MDISFIRKTLLELNVNTTIFFFTEYRLVKESWRRQNFLSIIKPLYPKNPVQWSPPDEIRSPKPTKRKEKGKTKFLVSIRLDRDSPTNRWRLLSSPPRGPGHSRHFTSAGVAGIGAKAALTPGDDETRRAFPAQSTHRAGGGPHYPRPGSRHVARRRDRGAGPINPGKAREWGSGCGAETWRGCRFVSCRLLLASLLLFALFFFSSQPMRCDASCDTDTCTHRCLWPCSLDLALAAASTRLVE